MRYRGLDRLRGLGLWMMVVHHLFGWTAGPRLARARLQGYEGYATTDLAPVLFTMAAGGAALIVGSRIRDKRGAGTGKALLRWAKVAAWGVALGIALDGKVDNLSVLEILAISGVAVTVLALAVGAWWPAWLALTAITTATADEAYEAAHDAGGLVGRVAGAQFPIVTYLAFAAAGALAVSILRTGEQPRRLAALSVVAAAVVGAMAVAGEWPPVRYPGDARFVVPGVLAGFAFWTALATPSVVRALGPVAVWLERSSTRTLLVFVAHYAIRIWLDHTERLYELREAPWMLAAGATSIAIIAWSSRPLRAAPK